MGCPSCFVTQIDLKYIDTLRSYCEEHQFTITHPEHTLFQAKQTHLSCTLYPSGKLVVQGKNTTDFVTFFLEPEILHRFDFTHPPTHDLTPRIGVDESGKGDFFGPLCVAAVYANEHHIAELSNLKVKDSKKCSDKMILIKAPEIKKLCTVTSVVLFPEKYNELYGKFKNLNRLLAWGHSTCIHRLYEKTGCTLAYVDQFASKELLLGMTNPCITLVQNTKGESDIVVAAASIMARYLFIQGLKQLEEEAQTPLPKGAGTQAQAAARRLAQRYGKEQLSPFVKMHFKNFQDL